MLGVNVIEALFYEQNVYTECMEVFSSQSVVCQKVIIQASKSLRLMCMFVVAYKFIIYFDL